jgi:hypothetical protein
MMSQDNGLHWDPIEGSLISTSYIWDTSHLSPGTEYRLKVLVADGFNTGYDISDTPFTILDQIFIPLVRR